MDKKLTKKILDFILETYPEAKHDSIVLTGSRAYGFSKLTSDIDILIYTANKKYYEKQSIQKGFRKKREDAGLEYRINKKILLEIKIKDYKLPSFDPIQFYGILNSENISVNKEFIEFKKELKNIFLQNYEKLLMYSYISFLNEFKQLGGILKRKDSLSKINLQIQKSITIQRLMRLAIVIDKKNYPSNKRLSHSCAKSKQRNKVKKLSEKIKNLNSFDKMKKIKTETKSMINNLMPKKDYVGNRRKFLDEFQKIKF